MPVHWGTGISKRVTWFLFQFFPYFQRKLHSNNAPNSPRVPGYSWCTLKSESCPIDCGEVVTCASTRLPRRSSVLGILVPKETHDPKQIHREVTRWPYVMEHLRNFTIIIIIIIIIIIRSHGFIHSHPDSMAAEGYHHSGNYSCATESGCTCEADEMSCQDLLFRGGQARKPLKHHGEYIASGKLM